MITEFDYPRSHQKIGLNEEILHSHPGGAIVEIGGGVRNRFARVTSAPPVVNINRHKTAAGNVVLPLDLNTLEKGLNDPRVRTETDKLGGVGTVIMSHVLYDVRPGVIRALMKSSAENLLPEGSIWIMRLGYERQRQSMLNIQEASVKRVQELSEFAQQYKTLEESIDALRGNFHVRMGTIFALSRGSLKKLTKNADMENFFQKYWQLVEKEMVSFAVEHGLSDRGDIIEERIDHTTHKMWILTQQIIQLSRSEQQSAEWWDSILDKRTSILEKNKEWFAKQSGKKK